MRAATITTADVTIATEAMAKIMETATITTTTTMETATTVTITMETATTVFPHP